MIGSLYMGIYNAFVSAGCRFKCNEMNIIIELSGVQFGRKSLA